MPRRAWSVLLGGTMILPESDKKKNPMNEENIYAPPKANLELDVVPFGPISHVFYVVSKRKFCILYISTFGLYKVYWFYKNWELYKKETQTEIWPVARAIFPVFFIHSLLALVERRILLRQKSSTWKPALHATILVILMITTYPLSRVSFHFSYTFVIVIAILMALFFGLYIAQGKINLACGDPKGESNDVLTPANLIWIVLGILILIVNAFKICIALSGIHAAMPSL